MNATPFYGGAGAVWDIWPRVCRLAMRRFQLRHASKFNAEGVNPICMSMFKEYPSDTSPSMLQSYGGAGAVWDIWPRGCRPAIERFLVRRAKEFKAECTPGNDNEDEDGKKSEDDMLHPIHDQVSISWWLQIVWLSQGIALFLAFLDHLFVYVGRQLRSIMGTLLQSEITLQDDTIS